MVTVVDFDVAILLVLHHFSTMCEAMLTQYRKANWSSKAVFHICMSHASLKKEDFVS